ncbi:hypothetical protein [Cohaesibacter celericrescens]|uniref:hypothetical protein n=1 Tax=Cohaesibacter celericrescens TaxID=2067669 RepID=UPI0015E15564|nr:hypothetical protein [Cohaesibacter celericrescens]
MTKPNMAHNDAILVAIDISKARHEVLIAVVADDGFGLASLQDQVVLFASYPVA